MPKWAWAIIVIGIFVIFAFIMYRTWRLVSYRFNQEKRQLPELVDRKNFVTSDQTKLPFAGHLAKDPKHIYLGIHDFLGSPKTFNRFFTKKGSVSWVSFGFPTNSNKPIAVGRYVAYCGDVIMALHNARPQATIILVLEGYSCGLVNKILKKNAAVAAIIYFNPISNSQRLRTSAIVKFFYGIGFLFSWNIIIPMHINYEGLTKNKLHRQMLENKDCELTLQMIWQYKFLNKHWPKNHSINIPQKIIQSIDDPFYSKIRLQYWKETYFKNIDYLEITDQLHFDLNLSEDDLIIH